MAETLKEALELLNESIDLMDKETPPDDVNTSIAICLYECYENQKRYYNSLSYNYDIKDLLNRYSCAIALKAFTQSLATSILSAYSPRIYTRNYAFEEDWFTPINYVSYRPHNSPLDGSSFILEEPQIKLVKSYETHKSISMKIEDITKETSTSLTKSLIGKIAYDLNHSSVLSLSKEVKESPDLIWHKEVPEGSSKEDHFSTFDSIIELAKGHVQDSCKRKNPNYIIIAYDVLPILSLSKFFKTSSIKDINGMFKVGTYNDMNVYVSEVLEKGRFILGVFEPFFGVNVGGILPYELCRMNIGDNLIDVETRFDTEVLNPTLMTSGRIV